MCGMEKGRMKQQLYKISIRYLDRNYLPEQSGDCPPCRCHKYVAIHFMIIEVITAAFGGGCEFFFSQCRLKKKHQERFGH